MIDTLSSVAAFLVFYLYGLLKPNRLCAMHENILTILEQYIHD